MSFEIQAVYENGVLKPERPLPLTEHQRVTVQVHDESSVARSSWGMMGWQGDTATLRKIALDVEFDLADMP